jgi:5-methylcytosine-specific restriction endonuclease McrA
MSVFTELAAWWFTTIAQLTGSKRYRLRSRGMSPTQARTRMLRDKINPRLRWKVLKRDNFTCTKCGRKPPTVRLEVDHIYPLSKGGTNTEQNLATICTICNSGKGATI